MKVFDTYYFDKLITKAKTNPHKRQHSNIHESLGELCQRLFNAIEPSSYIRPHRHISDLRDELLIAVRALMALMMFDDFGNVNRIMCFGLDKLGTHGNKSLAVDVDVPADTWHSVIALEPGCVFLEVKAGPFDPDRAKDFALWAPEEGSPAAGAYLDRLLETVSRWARS